VGLAARDGCALRGFSIRVVAFVSALAASAQNGAALDLRSGALELDPSKTLVEFRLPGSLHTTHGTFKLERGTIIADPATGKAGGSIVVDARSGDTGIGKRDNDMREGVLEAQRYPEITLDPQHFTLKLEKDGQFQAKLDGVLTIHGARHEIVTDVRGQLAGNSLTASCHFSVPYVEWGMEDPSLFFLTVAKQVDIDIATEGRITWNRREKVTSQEP
jgi:polyisoprenoid-binding protein YceI